MIGIIPKAKFLPDEPIEGRVLAVLHILKSIANFLPIKMAKDVYKRA